MSPEAWGFLGLLVTNIAGVMGLLFRMEKHKNTNGEAISKTGVKVDEARHSLTDLLETMLAKHEREILALTTEKDAAVLRYLQCEEREREAQRQGT